MHIFPLNVRLLRLLVCISKQNNTTEKLAVALDINVLYVRHIFKLFIHIEVTGGILYLRSCCDTGK